MPFLPHGDGRGADVENHKKSRKPFYTCKNHDWVSFLDFVLATFGRFEIGCRVHPIDLAFAVK